MTKLAEIEKAEAAVTNWQGYPFLADDVRWLIARVKRLEEALESITKRGKGRGGAVLVTTETLRSIACKALEADDE